MNRQKIIPVVLAADNNYIFPLAVTIMSLLKNKDKNTKYNIYVIVDELFDENNFFQIISKNVVANISFIKTEKNILKRACLYNEGLSVFTYCRLLISRLLPQIEKCIYIDTDLVVLDDLKKLYAKDIENNYIAGVKDYAVQNLFKKGQWEVKNLDIPNEKQYINAGVLLLNLKKIREDNIDILFIENIGKNWRLEDQDILNKCCYGKIEFLDLKYNIFYRYYKNIGEFKEGFYSKSELEEAEKNPVIIHYTGSKMKPWKNTRIRASKLWWEIVNEFFSEKEIYNLKEEVLRFERNLQWSYIIEKCFGKNLVIFGFSAIGLKVFQWLQNSGINIYCFCDNDKTKLEIKFHNIYVKSLNELKNHIDEYTFLIVSQNASTEIRRQLIEAGVKEIVTYYDKGLYYYMALDSEFFEEEIAEIEAKENIKRENFTKEIEEKFWMDKWIYKF